MASLDINDLRWLIVAAQHRSLRRAAEALRVRQSTLSRRLRYLEDQLGAELFERTKSGTHLTMAGRSFLDTAKRITVEIDAALLGVRAYTRGEAGQLIIGTCVSFSAGNLRATLADYRVRFSEVNLHFIDRAREPLISDVAAGYVDIAIVAGKPDWIEPILPLWAERVVTALPQNHPLSVSSVIRWDDFVDEPVIVNRHDPGPQLQRLLITASGASRSHRVAEHDANIDHLLCLVGLGLGLALVTEGATGASYPGVVFREVHDDNGPVRLPFFALWRKDNENPVLKSFLDLLRERYPDLAASPSADR